MQTCNRTNPDYSSTTVFLLCLRLTLILCFIFSFKPLLSQTKKEQISSLTIRVDSLQQVLSGERIKMQADDKRWTLLFRLSERRSDSMNFLLVKAGNDLLLKEKKISELQKQISDQKANEANLVQLIRKMNDSLIYLRKSNSARQRTIDSLGIALERSSEVEEVDLNTDVEPQSEVIQEPEPDRELKGIFQADFDIAQGIHTYMAFNKNGLYFLAMGSDPNVLSNPKNWKKTGSFKMQGSKIVFDDGRVWEHHGSTLKSGDIQWFYVRGL